MKVKKLAPAMGAEITGIDLGSSDFSDNLIGEIRAVWLEHNMLVLRGQNLTPQQQLRLGVGQRLADPPGGGRLGRLRRSPQSRQRETANPADGYSSILHDPLSRVPRPRRDG